MMKFYVVDGVIIFMLAAFLILANQLEWLVTYKAFLFIPFLITYMLGKWMGQQQAQKENKH